MKKAITLTILNVLFILAMYVIVRDWGISNWSGIINMIIDIVVISIIVIGVHQAKRCEDRGEDVY